MIVYCLSIELYWKEWASSTEAVCSKVNTLGLLLDGPTGTRQMDGLDSALRFDD